jgi:trans-aconitate 2-methyltransferase
MSELRDWNPAQYLKFERERSRAPLDLARRARQRLPGAIRIVDLGCGPGTSTAILAGIFPGSHITGLDASPNMLTAARAAHPELRFEAGDIGAWAESPGAEYELVFANSVLHWLPAPETLLPRLLARAAPGGVLAFQIPANRDAPVYQLPRELAALQRWRSHFKAKPLAEWQTYELSFFYQVLAPHCSDLELWETVYVQPWPGPESVLAWYEGSGLRPYLAALPSEIERSEFRAAYLEGLRAAYRPQPDGRLLFPFRRRFVVAQHPG